MARATDVAAGRRVAPALAAVLFPLLLLSSSAPAPASALTVLVSGSPDCIGIVQPYEVSLGLCTPFLGAAATIYRAGPTAVEVAAFPSSSSALPPVCEGAPLTSPLISLPYSGACVQVAYLGSVKGMRLVTSPPPNPLSPGMFELGVFTTADCSGGSSNYTLPLQGCTLFQGTASSPTGPVDVGFSILTEPSPDGLDVTTTFYLTPDCTLAPTGPGSAPNWSVTTPVSPLAPVNPPGSCIPGGGPVVLSSSVRPGLPGRFDPSKTTFVVPAPINISCFVGSYLEGRFFPTVQPASSGSRVCVTYNAICQSAEQPGCNAATFAAGEPSSALMLQGSSYEEFALLSSPSNSAFYRNISGCGAELCNEPPGPIPELPLPSAVDLRCWTGFEDAASGAAPVQSVDPIPDARLCFSAGQACTGAGVPIPSCTAADGAANAVIARVYGGAALDFFVGNILAQTQFFKNVSVCGTGDYCLAPPAAPGQASPTPSPSAASTPSASPGAANTTATPSSEAPLLLPSVPDTRAADIGAGAGITIAAALGLAFIGLAVFHPSSPLRRARYGSRSRYFSKWDVVPPRAAAGAMAAVGITIGGGGSAATPAGSSATRASNPTAERVEQLARVPGSFRKPT